MVVIGVFSNKEKVHPAALCNVCYSRRELLVFYIPKVIFSFLGLISILVPFEDAEVELTVPIGIHSPPQTAERAPSRNQEARRLWVL